MKRGTVNKEEWEYWDKKANEVVYTYAWNTDIMRPLEAKHRIVDFNAWDLDDDKINYKINVFCWLEKTPYCWTFGLDIEELRTVLSKAMLLLTPIQKDVIIKRFYEGKTWQQISDEMNVKRQGAYIYMERALVKMKRFIEEYMEERNQDGNDRVGES